MFSELKNVYENRHDYARKWKKEHPNGKVLGYFCTYIPEEIYYAADILPVRILGSHETQSVTEPHIFGMYCPFCRDVLAQGLQGRYDYLDGIMISQSCLHLRQSFASWKKHVPHGSYHYYLNMPHGNQTPHAVPYLREELVTLKKSVETWIGDTISDEALVEGIKLMNKSRRLMKQIYETRKAPNPPLTGLEAMVMVVSGQMMDKREHNEILEKILAELPHRTLDRETGVRLMTIGSEDDDVAFTEMLESLNATVVIDEHCTGSRYFWNETIMEDSDPMKAIAERYVFRPPCPSKDWPDRSRFQHILNLAKEYNVTGAILIQQKFCDPHEFDNPVLKGFLEGNDIKCYPVELDAVNALGPFKVRLEAFLEMINADELPFE